MEPMNATADVRADRVTVWAPTQVPTASRAIAAQSIGQELGVDAGAVGNDDADKVRSQFFIGCHRCLLLVWPREREQARQESARVLQLLKMYY